MTLQSTAVAISSLLPVSSTHQSKMSSGIKVSQCAQKLFCEMKVCPKGKSQMRLAILTIQNNEIEVAETYCDCDLGKDGRPEDPYDILCERAKDDCCFYFLYDCHYETTEGHPKADLVFGSWIPDSCRIKDRMTYSSSRCGIKNSCRGVKHNLQLSDKSELYPRAVFADGLEKNCPCIQTIEGKPVRCTQQQHLM